MPQNDPLLKVATKYGKLTDSTNFQQANRLPKAMDLQTDAMPCIHVTLVPIVKKVKLSMSACIDGH